MNSNNANKAGGRELLLKCASAATGVVALGLLGIQGLGIIFGLSQHAVGLAALLFTRFGREVETEKQTLEYTPPNNSLRST
jgi:hypothetical protein